MLNINFLNKVGNNNIHASCAEEATLLQEDIRAKKGPYKIFDIDLIKLQINKISKNLEILKNNYRDIIIIGMGGATLNPQSLINMVEPCAGPKLPCLHFLDSTDPLYLNNLLNKISLDRAAIIAISNSGQTLETNALVGVMIAELKKKKIRDLGKRFFFITKPNSGMLGNIAKELSATIIEHLPEISGRFSGLTTVSIVPAVLGGIDIDSYLLGAQLAIQQFLSNHEALELILDCVATILSSKKPILVNIGYLKQFSPFLKWYCQIIAESLGKDGNGLTPVSGVGPDDQHSMLQLYLDGPRDKIYNLFYANHNCDFTTCDASGLDYIANKSLSEINSANLYATQNALASKGNLIRTTILKDLSAKSVGYLTAFSMIEIILLGRIMKVNPFNQPGVELIKIKSKELVSRLINL